MALKSVLKIRIDHKRRRRRATTQIDLGFLTGLFGGSFGGSGMWLDWLGAASFSQWGGKSIRLSSYGVIVKEFLGVVFGRRKPWF